MENMCGNREEREKHGSFALHFALAFDSPTSTAIASPYGGKGKGKTYEKDEVDSCPRNDDGGGL